MKQLFRYVASILFVLSVNISHAQVVVPTPSWVAPIDISTVRDVDAKTIKGGYFYLVVDEQVNAVLHHSFYHYATKVVSEAGLEAASQIEINYDPSYQKVLLHFIRIRRGSQLIDRTTNSGMKTLTEENQRGVGILNGDVTLYANLSDIRKGDIIEYAYSIQGHNKIFGNYFGYDFWFAYNVPVGRIVCRLVTAEDTQLSIQNKNCKLKPTIEQGKIKTYTWLVNNVQPILLEDNVPSSYSPYPSVQVSNLKSWVEVKAWFSSLFFSDKYDDSKLRLLVDSIKGKHSGSLEDQVTAMVDFTQKVIRYSGNEHGIYSHKPHLPDYVMKNMYGDCKDKSLLLHELLKHIGVVSYPALVNTIKKNSITTENPSLNRFDHCILAISYKNKLVYIDPTDSYQAGSFLNREISNYEAALLIDGKNSAFNTVPTPNKGLVDIIETFAIDTAGNASLYVETKYEGAEADKIRNYFSNFSLVEIQDSYRSFYLKYANEVEVVDTITFKDKGNNVFTIQERYLLKKFWIQTDSSSGKISKDFIPYVLNDYVGYVTDVVRKYPLEIKYPANVHQRIVVVKSGGWNISNPQINEDNEFFSYCYTADVSGDSLQLDYTYKTKSAYVPVGSYLRYKAKVDIVDKNMIMSVHMNDNNSSIYGFNWLLLITFIVGVVLSVALCRSLYLHKFTVQYEKRYDTVGGWLILVAIGIVITPFALLFTIVKQSIDLFNINYFYYFFDSRSDFFYPLKGYYVIVSDMCNVLLLVASIMIIVLLFQRKKAFRYYYIGFRLFNLLFLSVDLAMVYLFATNPMGADDAILVKTQSAALVKMAVQACIWIPYVWISERSRHTFVND